jgi:hypothetical protein
VRLYAALYAIGLVVYGLLAWERIDAPSTAPQYVYQADAWLHGRISVEKNAYDADWAGVETVTLDDGSEVRGRRLVSRPTFRTLGGDEVPTQRVRASKGITWYVSFPPLPTLLMLPSALVSGRDGNAMIPTLLVAAAILPLALLVLRRLAAAKLSTRSLVDDLWLVAALAFGTVFFYTAVQGTVWYTAHVVAVACTLVYAWASIEAKRPVVAGIAIACAALTRPTMAFMAPLFLLEAWRMHGKDGWRVAVRFAIPIVALAIPAMIYNYVRFGSPTEFGHSYLAVIQQQQIEQFGLANYHYLARNLAVAFTLLPELVGQAPWVRVGGHGLALWFTTPLVLFALWPRERPPIHRALWITIACVALPSLLYQNSGWVQFGYRFALDYLPFVVMLVAIGGRPMNRLVKAAIVFGVVVNLFGAITFDRYGWRYYRVDRDAYGTIVAH